SSRYRKIAKTNSSSIGTKFIKGEITMAIYTGDPNKEINLATTEFTTQTPGHPNSFNPKFRQMLDNDANLDKRINDHKNASVLDHPDGSVTTSKLADGAVTSGKLAAEAATDTVIGTRTINDASAPNSDTGSPTNLWSW